MDQARRRAARQPGTLGGPDADNLDPAAEKKATRAAVKAEQSANDRVADVAKAFVEKYLKRHVGDGWARESERLLRVDVLPNLGAKRLGDVKRADVLDMLDDIVARGAPIGANRTHAAFSRLCNWAVERGIIAVSPCAGLKAPAAENSRDRVLSDDEIGLAWRAFEAIGWPHGSIAKLLLLTGARRGEVAGMQWAEIDTNAKTWTIAKERSKNGVAHEIPLVDAAIKILEALPRIEGRSGLVFTLTGSSPIYGFSKVKTKIDAAMAANGEALAPW